jgi:hypothetical protein
VTTAPLHLLLAGADDRRPALAGGLAGDALDRTAAPAGLPEARQLRDRGRDPNDLAVQRWALIVPEGDAGARREAQVRALVEHRRAEQGCDVRVYRVPAAMDAADAARWHREVYLDERVAEAELPFYQLILGDLDEVPLALQQVQMIDGAVGRLAFDDDAGYEAYVDKLLRWERAPAAIPRARSLFYTAHDGTPATAHAYQALIGPGLAAARAGRDQGAYAAADIAELGDPGAPPSRDDLLTAAADPAVLLSVSHGQGPPRRGWSSAAEQRRRQGALSLGADGAVTGDELAGRRFLPGGVWLLFACYGAGTPATSVYQPWLERLRDAGQYGDRLDGVLRGLPRPGERPFIAGLPRAVLASPDGPLAVIGHVDLAWSYSFEELDGSAGPRNRVRRFTSLLACALRRDRVGVAFRELVSCAIAADTELLALYARQAVLAAAAPDPGFASRLGHLWMLRHDLLGYLLLGDPAARLPITPAPVAAAQPLTPQDLFGFAVMPAASVAVLGVPSPAQPPAPSPAMSVEALEQAIVRVLAGERADAVAAAHGLDRAELDRLAGLYRAAGRAAIARGRGPAT